MTSAQSAAWQGRCPACSGEASWQSSVTGGETGRVTVAYRIDCEACGPEPIIEAAPIVPLPAHPVSVARAAWIGDRRSSE